MLTELDELDSSSGWVPLFQKLNWIARENAGSQKIAKLPENRLQNRYRDVLPYDHSRILLEEGESDYINANLVEVKAVNRRYILTQGPLKHTATHFWQMVWEQKSQAIVMLNRVIEKNQIKCYQYWPCGEKVGHTNVLEFGNFRITYIEESMSDYFTVRTLEIYNIKEEETRNIFQFHYLHWPDFGVPSSPATFLSFLFEARNAGVLSEDVGPAIIHCSAGIGRSGTFIMVDSILKQVEKTEDLNGVDIKNTLLEMRQYRLGLIQTPDQLRFTYASILEGTHLLMPQVYNEALDKFQEGRELEEEEEDDNEVPPPVPARKRQETEQTVEQEANIAPKRRRSLPDIPKEGSSAVPETPKESSVAAAAHDTSKGISSFQALQADMSSDETDGEDEIIDLSASSSSTSGEESEEVSTKRNNKEEPSNEREDKKDSTKEREEKEDKESVSREADSKLVSKEITETRDNNMETESELVTEETIDATEKDNTKMDDKKDPSNEGEVKKAFTKQDKQKVCTCFVEQENHSIKEKLVDENKDRSKALESNKDLGKTKHTRPLSEDSGIGGTEPAFAQNVSSSISTEKMDFPKRDEIESDIISQPMESKSSESLESEPYARIINVEKVARTKGEVSSESIGGNIGTNPRESNPEIRLKEQDHEKKVTQGNPADDVNETSASKESEADLRRRKRQEKKEKTEKIVNDIKAKVKYEENTRLIRKIIKNSLIVVAVCSVAYLAFRCYRYFFRAPRRRFPRM